MAGLLNKLTSQGSVFSIANGGPVAVNPLSTRQSKLHADGSDPGYSITGANSQQVSSQYNQYIDGKLNSLPQPSLLDMNGINPPKYMDNLPG